MLRCKYNYIYMFIILCDDAFCTSHDFDLHGVLQNARCSCKRPFTQTNHLTRWLVLKSILCKYIYVKIHVFFRFLLLYILNCIHMSHPSLSEPSFPQLLKIMSGGTLGPSLGKAASGGPSHCFYGSLTPSSGKSNEERRAWSSVWVKKRKPYLILSA